MSNIEQLFNILNNKISNDYQKCIYTRTISKKGKFSVIVKINSNENYFILNNKFLDEINIKQFYDYKMESYELDYYDNIWLCFNNNIKYIIFDATDYTFNIYAPESTLIMINSYYNWYDYDHKFIVYKYINNIINNKYDYNYRYGDLELVNVDYDVEFNDISFNSLKIIFKDNTKKCILNNICYEHLEDGNDDPNIEIYNCAEFQLHNQLNYNSFKEEKKTKNNKENKDNDDKKQYKIIEQAMNISLYNCFNNTILSDIKINLKTQTIDNNNIKNYFELNYPDDKQK